MYTIDNKCEIGKTYWTAVQEISIEDCYFCKNSYFANNYSDNNLCPICKGKGLIYHYNTHKYIPIQVEITSFFAHIVKGSIGITYKTKLIEKDTPYKCKKRGEEWLFKSYEEAIDFCEKINKKINQQDENKFW